MESRHTAPGFTAVDWALMAGVAVIWGASFLFIDIAVEHLRPELVAVLRVAFGVATLAVIPAARAPVPRSAWPMIGLLGVVWMAAPFVLFPLAEQRIDSSLAGVINAAAPLFTAVVAMVSYRRVPATTQVAGLLIGFLGVLVVVGPSLAGAKATTIGVGFALLATLLYGFAFTLAAPLQQRYGALAVIWRAQLVALVVLAPWGLTGIAGSTFTWSSTLAVAALGCLGTAIAFVAFVTFVGRVGPTRASVTVYFLPAVAIALGALVRDEAIAPLSVAGVLLVAAGALVVSRANQTPIKAPQNRPHDSRDTSSG